MSAVAVGGALGGGARYGLNLLWPTPAGGFPWATFVENVSGALLLGALMVFLVAVWPDNRYLRPFLGVGVLGGYTTFSAFATEVDALVREDAGLVALGYLLATLTCGFLATLVGMAGARRIVTARTAP